MLKVRAWLAVVACAVTAALASAADIRVGGQCDLTGATKVIGTGTCAGAADYFTLVNRKGGVAGNRLVYIEADNAYMVPRAIEAYERQRREGIVTLMSYGVPTLYGLTSRLMDDRIPAFNTGTGRSDAIDGETWPYIFPGTASYWSQAGAAMQHLKNSGARKGTRVAFLYYDNPAGREAMPVIDAVAEREGFELRKFPVQPPGLELEPEVSAIVRTFKADWVIASLFGNPVPVAIREFRRAGYPLERVLSFVYGGGDADVEAAGWDTAQGYLALQYAFVGREHPVIQEIAKMYRDDGKEIPKHVGSVYYNRGVLLAAQIVEGIRLAIRNDGLPLTGDKVRRGYESIREFDAKGLGPPVTITPKDHEGGGYMRVYQVKGSGWVPVTGWLRGYRDEVMAQVRKANAR